MTHLELRSIDRTDRARARLDAALGIYRETILPEAQNPERQILYWIEHSKDDLTDEFRCFAIERSNEVIGYLQYSFFREEHIFFFEYLCIRDRNRNGLVPSQAMRNIEDFLAQNYRPGFTIVFEVAQKRTTAGVWHPDQKLIAYFNRLGFRTVDFAYRYPILQSYDGEMSYPADLMIRLPNARTSVTSSEMRTILRCIYFKHYLRWDRPFLEPERFSERERLINELYSEEVNHIGGNDSFGTRGDPKRSQMARFKNRQPRITGLLERVFGPKLVKMITLIFVLLVVQWFLKSFWLLVPFVFASSALYCLTENTEASRKLFVMIMNRLRPGRPGSS
jgi:hypothetical protein